MPVYKSNISSLWNSVLIYTAVMMKFTLGLFAVLAIVGLGQAHKIPHLAKSSLSKDIHDILDLVPKDEIAEIIVDYVLNDPEVQRAIEYLKSTTLIKDLMVDLQAIPEVIKLLNFMHKEEVNVYSAINKINKLLDIKELVPPTYYAYATKRTGGIAGLFKDMKKQFDYDKFIRIYVKKMKTSPAFVRFIDELKSDNFQQLINKLYEIESYQIILNYLKSHGVNTQLVSDVMFIVLGIRIPNDPDLPHAKRTLEDDLRDFVELIPLDKILAIILDYVENDQQVQKAIFYLLTPEFHKSLKGLEALKEHQALVTYLEKAGLPIIRYIQSFHENIGMDDYVPPKVESIFESLIGVQKIGDGIKGMLMDIYATLPLDKLEALFEDKMKNSKIFAEFIAKVRSPKMQELLDNLHSTETYRNFVVKLRENGWKLQEASLFNAKIFGLNIPY